MAQIKSLQEMCLNVLANVYDLRSIEIPHRICHLCGYTYKEICQFIRCPNYSRRYIAANRKKFIHFLHSNYHNLFIDTFGSELCTKLEIPCSSNMDYHDSRFVFGFIRPILDNPIQKKKLHKLCIKYVKNGFKSDKWIDDIKQLEFYEKIVPIYQDYVFIDKVGQFTNESNLMNIS